MIVPDLAKQSTHVAMLSRTVLTMSNISEAIVCVCVDLHSLHNHDIPLHDRML
jgi:hypothetical protein